LLISAHGHPGLGVEIGVGLVEEEDLGLSDDGPPHGHALPLASRESLASSPRLLMPRMSAASWTLCSISALENLRIISPKPGSPDVHVPVEGVVLEDHGDVPVLEGFSLTSVSPM
jgi:hypothetical protein